MTRLIPTKRLLRLRRWQLVVPALSALILAACGSSSGNSSSGGPSGDTVTVGLSISLTGANAKTGQEVLNGYQLWADDVNKSGGLLGKQVKIKYYDDGTDPATGVQLYTKLITQDKVDLVIGPFGSDIAEPVAAVTERYKYPMVAGGSSSASIWSHGYHYVFGVYPTGAAQDDSLLAVGKGLGAKTVAIVNEATAFPRDTASGVKDGASKYGMKVTYQQEFPANATDFTGVVAKLSQHKADYLIAGTYYDESTLLAKQLNSAGTCFPLFAETIGPDEPDFASSVGKAAEGLLGVTPWSPGATTPGNKAYLKEYTAKYHDPAPIYQAAEAYSAGQVLAAAVKKAGSFDHTKIRDALQKLQMVTIAGDYKVDATGAQVAAPDYVTQVQNGKPVVVYPPKYATAKAQRIAC